MKQITLEALRRTDSGRTAAKRLRQAGKLPAVIYGESGTELLTLDAHRFKMAYRSFAGKAVLITLKIEGHENDTFAVIQEIQRDALTDAFEHLDFREIQRGKPMEAVVPVVAVGTANGVKNQGGILEVTLPRLTVRCRPRDLPEAIEVDVSALNIAESIHVSQIKAPEGVTILTSGDEVVVACVGSSAGASAAADAPAAAAAAPAAAPAPAAKKAAAKK